VAGAPPNGARVGLTHFHFKEKRMVNMKILGPGCANCRKLEAVAREAAAAANVQAEFVKVSDMKQIMQYDLLSTPGLVVNDKLVSSGRIPTLVEVQQWLSA
jgi:small redox-active disulfide protein 2